MFDRKKSDEPNNNYLELQKSLLQALDVLKSSTSKSQELQEAIRLLEHAVTEYTSTTQLETATKRVVIQINKMSRVSGKAKEARDSLVAAVTASKRNRSRRRNRLLYAVAGVGCSIFCVFAWIVGSIEQANENRASTQQAETGVVLLITQLTEDAIRTATATLWTPTYTPLPTDTPLPSDTPNFIETAGAAQTATDFARRVSARTETAIAVNQAQQEPRAIAYGTFMHKAR